MASPGDFHIGVLDFFSVLLPGALLVGVAVVLDLPEGATTAVAEKLTFETARVGAFVGASYAVGQLCNAVGSTVLDYLYDLLYSPGAGWLSWRTTPLEKLTSELEQKREAELKKPSDAWIQEASARARLQLALLLLLPGGLWEGGAESRKHRLKSELDELARHRKVRGVYQAVRAFLKLSHPSAFAEIEKLEGEQKFFRSITVGALVLYVAGQHRGHPTLQHWSWACLAVALFAAFRYLALRRKSVERAYTYFAMRDSAAAPKGQG